MFRTVSDFICRWIELFHVILQRKKGLVVEWVTLYGKLS